MTRPYHHDTPDGLAVSADPADARRMGLVRLFVAPPAVVLLSGLVWLVYDVPVGFLAVVDVLAVGILVPVGLVGVVRSLGAGREAVVASDSVALPDGRVLRDVRRVVVDKPSAALQWEGLFVETPGGRVLLVGGVPLARGRELAAAAEAVAARLGVPAVVPERARRGSRFVIEGKTMAALCYMPLQGIGLGLSLWALRFGAGPEVRFAARQSLLFWAISTAALLALLLGAIGVGAATGAFEGSGAGVALLVVGIGVPVLARIGVFGAATLVTWRRGYWVIPGLGRWSRKWLPADY